MKKNSMAAKFLSPFFPEEKNVAVSWTSLFMPLLSSSPKYCFPTDAELPKKCEQMYLWSLENSISQARFNICYSAFYFQLVLGVKKGICEWNSLNAQEKFNQSQYIISFICLSLFDLFLWTHSKTSTLFWGRFLSTEQVMRVPACLHIRMGGVCSTSPHM